MLVSQRVNRGKIHKNIKALYWSNRIKFRSPVFMTLRSVFMSRWCHFWMWWSSFVFWCLYMARVLNARLAFAFGGCGMCFLEHEMSMVPCVFLKLWWNVKLGFSWWVIYYKIILNGCDLRVQSLVVLVWALRLDGFFMGLNVIGVDQYSRGCTWSSTSALCHNFHFLYVKWPSSMGVCV